jgi:hypothetical protein
VPDGRWNHRAPVRNLFFQPFNPRIEIWNP